MSIFRKKEVVDFDIHCRDRTLKNLIDECYHEKPDWDGYYETRVTFYVEEGIKYRKLLKKLLEDGYAKHKSDFTCDIPDYKTFLSIEQIMIDNKEEYKNKTICIEGYIYYIFRPLYPNKWSCDTAGYWIYPLPCKTETEKEINYALVDDLCATDSVTLVSDQPLTIENGMHLRAYGIPYFYEAWDGGRPAKVHILVQRYEILD